MHVLMIACNIISILLIAACGTLAVLLAGKQRERVLAVLYRFTGETDRYIDERIAKVMTAAAAVLAVLEILNLVFRATIWVPAVCMAASFVTCYLSLLSIDRRCRKRDRGKANITNSESYHMEETDRRETV